VTVKSRLKRIGIAIVVLLVLLIGVPFAVGSMMSREHVATGDAIVRAPIEEVWATVSDYESMPRWWSERGAIVRQPDGSFRESSDDFVVTYRLREIAPPRRLVVELEDDAGYFGGTWTYELEPADGGTRVRITEEGWAGPGFFRFMVWAFGADATLRACLTALQAEHG
jgi:uncharacterized protein YndB with AHSA1/START domain